MRERLSAYWDEQARRLEGRAVSLRMTVAAAALTGLAIGGVLVLLGRLGVGGPALVFYWSAMAAASFFYAFRLGGRPAIVTLSLFLLQTIPFIALAFSGRDDSDMAGGALMVLVFFQVPTYVGAVFGTRARYRRTTPVEE
jgi:hypothetical protein